ncbi:Histidine triad nucleotide-binding protein 3 [Kappamyces sp. JEL0829]|nr:Histidine triad nucleotide-binding protein 3 [Kappamyces sp. JEL0829]
MAHVTPCVFCNIALNQTSLWHNNEFSLFHDIHPKARHHLLLIPNAHLEPVSSLQQPQAELIEKMQMVGRAIASKLAAEDALDFAFLDDESALASTAISPAPECTMGFHLEPLVLVRHLHMHILVGPYHGQLAHWLYPRSGGVLFLTPQQAVDRLRLGSPSRAVSYASVSLAVVGIASFWWFYRNFH